MSDMAISFSVLGALVVLFVWNRFPVEIVAIGAALTLYATGVLTLDQAISGFGDVTRLSHHGTSSEWCSSAMKFSVAAAVCTLAMNEIGEPAKCIAIGTPRSIA